VVLRAANQNRSIAGGNRSTISGFGARERDIQQPLELISLVTFLFSDKKVTPIIKEEAER